MYLRAIIKQNICTGIKLAVIIARWFVPVYFIPVNMEDMLG